MKIPLWLAAPALNAIYRSWCATLKVTESGREVVDGLAAKGEPMVFCLWHDEMFTLINARRSLRLITVVSQSRDGEYLARLLQAMGLKTARGSSSRGGVGALLRAARTMREENCNAVLTVDGPRGPRHKVKQGAVVLAFRTQARVVPVRLFLHRAKVFGSWDRFQLPLPFSRVHIVFGEPYTLSAVELSAQEVERERLELERRLNAIPAPDFQPRPRLTQAAQYAALRLLAGALSRLPWTALRRMAFFMGAAFWRLFPSRRREAVCAVQKHLKVSHEEARRIARQSFKENFLSFLEIFHVGRFKTFAASTRIRDRDSLAMLQAETAPVILTTAHLGSWELMPGLATDTLPRRLGMVVVRRQKNAALNRLMAELRGARGMLAIDHREAAAVVVPKLRAGGAAAFLVDHNTSRKEAVFLPFLEDTAAVNAGPAGLALRVKAAVYPVFLIRDGKGGHLFHVLPPLRTKDLTGSVNERVAQIARFYTDAVADMVRRHPEQWLWMHKRWKTRETDGENG